MSPRIPMPNDKVLSIGLPDTSELVPDLGPALHDVYLASSKLHDVDPITAEMVRLRNARHQDCHLCQGIRYADALEAGVTDEMLDKVDDYEHSDLPERRKAALRLADAYLLSGTAPSAEVAEQINEYFTPVEIAELLLRLNGWTNNKVFISLGLDLDEIRPQVLAL